MPVIHAMTGILYADKVSVEEIERMTYPRLKYWSDWSQYWNKKRAQAAKG